MKPMPDAPDKSYMSEIIRRAKTKVDPRKYSKVRDWGVESKLHGVGKIPKSLRVTALDEISKAKKQIPAPSFYKVRDDHRIPGTYKSN